MASGVGYILLQRVKGHRQTVIAEIQIFAGAVGVIHMGGGVGVAVALFDKGAVDGTQLAIVIPAIYLMGSQVQYMGRCLGVIGIQGSDMFKIMAVPPIVALLSLWVMRLVVLGS